MIAAGLAVLAAAAALPTQGRFDLLCTGSASTRSERRRRPRNPGPAASRSIWVGGSSTAATSRRT